LAYANAFEFWLRDFDAGKILPPPSNFPQSDLGCRADSRWALPQISSFIINDIHMKQIQKMQKMCQYSIYQINHNSAFLQIPVYIFKIFIININQ